MGEWRKTASSQNSLDRINAAARERAYCLRPCGRSRPLLTARAEPALADEAEAIRSEMDFSCYYNPAENQIRGGFWIEDPQDGAAVGRALVGGRLRQPGVAGAALGLREGLSVRDSTLRRVLLFGIPPIGYLRVPTGEWVIDPDEQVQAVVRLVFDQFDRDVRLVQLLRGAHEVGDEVVVTYVRGRDIETRKVRLEATE